MCANIRVPSSSPCTQYRLTAWPAYNCTLFVGYLETRNFNEINYPLADETCQNWKNDVLLTFKWPFCHVGIEFSVLLMLKMTLQTQCSCAARSCMHGGVEKRIFDDSDCWNRHQTSSFTRSGVRMTERDRRRQSTGGISAISQPGKPVLSMGSRITSCMRGAMKPWHSGTISTWKTIS